MRKICQDYILQFQDLCCDSSECTYGYGCVVCGDIGCEHYTLPETIELKILLWDRTECEFCANEHLKL